MAKISEENDKKKVSCNTRDNELKTYKFPRDCNLIVSYK